MHPNRWSFWNLMFGFYTFIMGKTTRSPEYCLLHVSFFMESNSFKYWSFFKWIMIIYQNLLYELKNIRLLNYTINHKWSIRIHSKDSQNWSESVLIFTQNNNFFRFLIFFSNDFADSHKLMTLVHHCRYLICRNGPPSFITCFWSDLIFIFKF